MPKIILVEDEKSLSEMIKMNLELEGYDVIVYDHGGMALKNIQDFIHVQLVILDVMLPEVSGLDLCRELRKFSNVPVLFLSAKGTTRDRIAGLKMGGNDYLAKPFDLEELLLRVQILTQRNDTESLEVEKIRIGNKEVNFTTFEISDPFTGEVQTISKKEIELLKLFTEREGKVVSRNEILDRIWGKDQFPTSRTIDNYILSFRKIFEKDPRNPIYFHSIRSVGYKFTNKASS
jgi:two-component system alkaline phosphatase synthesis response regulator PhoP